MRKINSDYFGRIFPTPSGLWGETVLGRSFNDTLEEACLLANTENQPFSFCAEGGILLTAKPKDSWRTLRDQFIVKEQRQSLTTKRKAVFEACSAKLRSEQLTEFQGALRGIVYLANFPSHHPSKHYYDLVMLYMPVWKIGLVHVRDKRRESVKGWQQRLGWKAEVQHVVGRALFAFLTFGKIPGHLVLAAKRLLREADRRKDEETPKKIPRKAMFFDFNMLQPNPVLLRQQLFENAVIEPLDVDHENEDVDDEDND